MDRAKTTKTLQISRHETGGVPVLDLQGKITLGESSRALRKALDEVVTEGHKRVILQMAKLTHLDSAGLGSLVAGYNSIKQTGGVIALVAVPERIREILELSRLTQLFVITDTEEQAARTTSS